MNKRNQSFSGIYTAVATPLFKNLEINCNELTHHCTDLIQKGCSGVVLFGTTGEGASFSVQEREQGLKAVIQNGINPSNIIMGIVCCSVTETAHLARKAIEHECPAVLIAPPYFFKKTSDDGVIDFYRQVIHQVNHPSLRILLYHIPQNTCVPITLPIIHTLRKEFPQQIIGIKESEGNPALTKEILSKCPDFDVFVANELYISEAVQLGVQGSICGIANIYPELICSLYEYGRDQRKPNNQMEAERLISELKKNPTIPAIKHILACQRGYVDWRLVRPPLVAL